MWGNFWGFFRLAVLLFLLSIPLNLIPFVGGLLAAAIETAAAVFAGVLVAADQELSALQSIRAAFNRVLPVLGVILLSLLAIFALAITIIGIPVAIYFAVRWVFLVQVVMLEQGRVLPAFSRSSDLIRGQWWRVFGSLLLMSLVSVLLFIGVIILFLVLAGILSLATPVLIIPILIAAFVVFIPFTNVGWVFITSFYIDSRARRESYGSGQLNRELGAYD